MAKAKQAGTFKALDSIHPLLELIPSKYENLAINFTEKKINSCFACFISPIKIATIYLFFSLPNRNSSA